MRTRTLKIMILLALILAAPLHKAYADPPVTPAPSAPGQSTPAQSPPAASAPYLLAAEDVISVTVLNFPDQSGQMVVPPDGNIKMPVMEESVSVTGKTTSQVEEELTTKLKKYIVSPSVSVHLVQKRKESVLIYGFVVKSGAIDYRRTLKASDALAEVGGGLPNADLTQVVLTHETGNKQILDLSHPEKLGTDAQVPLIPNDTIYVPERKTKVSVTGEVNKPGNIDWNENLTVSDAITLAGGYKYDTADLMDTTLTRGSKESNLNLDAFFKHGDVTVNIKLQPGDSIMVPYLHNRIYVFGAVSSAGFFIYSSGDRVLDAIKGTGGPNSVADLSRVNVIHVAKDKLTAKVEQVNMDKFLKKGDVKGNILLEPGDVVYIPEKKRKLGASDLLGVLGGLSLLSNAGHIFGLP